jgi:hypothetical protein
MSEDAAGGVDGFEFQIGPGLGNPTGRAGNLRVNFGSSDLGFYIYNQRSAPLRFGTDNAERMRIAANGRVGIGTVDPATTLHVNGAISLGTGARELEVREVSPADLEGWSSLIPYEGIGIGSNTGGARQMLMFTDGADSDNILTVATSENSGSSWEADFVIEQRGYVGIGTGSPSAELHVVGDICYTGTIGACSDARYKSGVEPVSDALDKVSRLRGVNFDWKTEEYPDRRFTDDRQVGFIGQELKEIVPEVVMEDDNGYLSVDYGRLTPVLVEAIKDLKTDNDDLRARMAELEARLAEFLADEQ